MKSMERGRAETEDGCGKSISEHDCTSDSSICRMHGAPGESYSRQAFVLYVRCVITRDIMAAVNGKNQQ